MLHRKKWAEIFAIPLETCEWRENTWMWIWIKPICVFHYPNRHVFLAFLIIATIYPTLYVVFACQTFTTSLLRWSLLSLLFCMVQEGLSPPCWLQERAVNPGLAKERVVSSWPQWLFQGWAHHPSKATGEWIPGVEDYWEPFWRLANTVWSLR